MVIGGENATLGEDIIPGRDEVIYGSGSAVSTYVFPEATRDAWKQFIRTETARPTVVAANNAASSGAVVMKGGVGMVVGVAVLITASICAF